MTGRVRKLILRKGWMGHIANTISFTLTLMWNELWNWMLIMRPSCLHWWYPYLKNDMSYIVRYVIHNQHTSKAICGATIPPIRAKTDVAAYPEFLTTVGKISAAWIPENKNEADREALPNKVRNIIIQPRAGVVYGIVAIFITLMLTYMRIIFFYCKS